MANALIQTVYNAPYGMDITGNRSILHGLLDFAAGSYLLGGLLPNLSSAGILSPLKDESGQNVLLARYRTPDVSAITGITVSGSTVTFLTKNPPSVGQYKTFSGFQNAASKPLNGITALVSSVSAGVSFTSTIATMATTVTDSGQAVTEIGPDTEWIESVSGSGYVYGYNKKNAAIQIFQQGASTAGNSSVVTTELGNAAAYALLASSGITSIGSTVITGGNIGSYPTASITGSPTLVSPAVIDNADAQAASAALTNAILYYTGLTATLSGLSNLSTGGNGSTAATYTPGNYFGSSSLTMPTGIILDAQGNANAVFVFVAGSTINLASGQTVSLINGAQAANVVFVAGTSFTSVATSTVNGNILAGASITLGGGVLNGRALASTGAVTISASTAITVAATTNSPLVELAAGAIPTVIVNDVIEFEASYARD